MAFLVIIIKLMGPCESNPVHSIKPLPTTIDMYHEPWFTALDLSTADCLLHHVETMILVNNSCIFISKVEATIYRYQLQSMKRNITYFRKLPIYSIIINYNRKITSLLNYNQL